MTTATAPTTARPAAAAPAGRSPFLLLLLLRWRRERVLLPVWILAIAGMTVVTTAAVVTTFGDEQARRELVTLALSTPAVLALRGIPNGYTTGSVVWVQGFTWLAVLTGLMNVFLATRHGRAEEQDGRRELLGATPLGRVATLTSTLLLGAVADLVLGIAVGIAFLAAGLDAQGALVAGAAFAVTGLAFLGVGALAGELLPTARAANSAGAAVVLLSYLLRAAGDATGTADLASGRLTPAAVSAFSPIGWGERTLAFTADRAVWLLPGVALAALTAIAAVLVRTRRDLGAAPVPERRGPAHAGRALRGPWGLTLRGVRGVVVAWVVGGAVLGAAIGSIATSAANAVADNPQLQRMLAALARQGQDSGVTLSSTLVVAITGIAGLLAAAAGCQVVLHLRAEETAGRLETVLAGPVSRRRVWAAAVVPALAATLLVLLATGLAALASFGASGDAATGRRAVEQALLQFPAAAAVVLTTALVLVLLPRVSTTLGWAVLAVSALLGVVGELAGLPRWLIDVSPFSHVPVAPVADATALVVVAAVAVVLAAVGWGAVRRRQVPA